MQFVGCKIQVLNPMDREQSIQILQDTYPDVLVLNTCQRIECFGYTIPVHNKWSVTDCISDQKAFERLVRIAAGLESRVFGEKEILGQVRQAYKHFNDKSGKTYKKLDRIFQDALSLARKIRKKCAIETCSTSLVKVIVDQATERLHDSPMFVIIGTGQLGTNIIRSLIRRKASNLHIVNRNKNKAAIIANQYNLNHSDLSELDQILTKADCVICATTATEPILKQHHLALLKRNSIVMDLGETSNCDQTIATSSQIQYLNLQMLESKILINTTEKHLKVKIADYILEQGVKAWFQKQI